MHDRQPTAPDPSTPGPDTTGNATKGHEGAMSAHLAPSGRGRRVRNLLQRRSLRLWLVLIVAMATVSVVGATAPLSARTSTAGATTPCSSDGNGGCLVTLPCASGQTTCPTIDVAPNTNLENDQYVYVTAKNFDPTGSIRVAFCAANTSPTDPSCLNGNWESQYLQPTAVPVTNDAQTQNLTSLSYPVFDDPAGEGNNQIPAYDLVNKHGQVAPFNCDDTTDPCELVVTYEPGQGASAGNGPTITAANSAVVPLNFAAPPSGCPASDPQVYVDSAFSLEHFIPAAIDATCEQKNGVVALNTATDDNSVIGDFAAGGTTIAFVDNASDPSQTASLLGKAYAYIPIALSGTTESFLAGESDQGQNFPINDLKLTPNMVAGLITSLYQSPVGNPTVSQTKPRFAYNLADNLSDALAAANPPVTCAQLVGCPSTRSRKIQFEYMAQYNAFEMLNPVPAGDYSPQTFGSFNSNVASGSSYQASEWLCNTPNAPFQVPVDEVGQSSPVNVTVTDTNVASTTLTTPPLGSSIWPPYPGATWVYPSCSGYSTFPALSATANNYGPAQSPAFQAKAMRTWCYGGTVLPQPPNPEDPCAAFGLMDTSEAQFYGLSTAAIENPAGQFVTPTIASLEAAASSLTACPTGNLSCPAGTYTIDYDDTNAAAYPMTNVTYAVVPTSTLSNTEGTAVKNLLTNLVTYSHSGDLPAGYAPLPTSLYSAALADIANDVSIAPAPKTPTTTTTSTTTAGSTTTTTNAGTSGSSDYSSGSTGYSSGASDYTPSSTQSALPLTSSSTGGGGSGTAKTPVVAPPASIPTGFLLVGLSATTRFLLPAIVVVTLASLLGGLLLLLGPGATRRRRLDGEDEA